MKRVYLLRHAEKNTNGVLTKRGAEDARQLGKELPAFEKVISSDSERAKLTAIFITGKDPEVDDRAGFYSTTQEKSDAITLLASSKGISFFEAANIYNNGELFEGINKTANRLNQLIDEVLTGLEENETALIVSHDMTISPAMTLRGQPRKSVGYLSGYIINEDGLVHLYNARF